MLHRTIMTLAGGASLVLATTPAAATSVATGGGTIAVTSSATLDVDDETDRVSREAVMTALGQRGFTILDDRHHAALVAEVMTTRSEVGTSVARARGEQPVVVGAGVSIPLSKGRSLLVAMQRLTIEIRIRSRGDDEVLWRGSAVTVRPEGLAGAKAERLAAELAQAALSSYPTVTGTAISVP